MSEPLLQVDNLTKHFPVVRGLLFEHEVGRVQAVDNVSFTIATGETLALVGESGCGKTTTTRMILRLETPTSGQILVDGRDVHRLEGAELKQHRSAVQAVFQDPWSSLNPRMRVHDIVSEALLANRKVSKSEVNE